MSPYAQALAVTILVETAVVVVVYPSARLRAGACCVLGTTASHLAMHHLLPLLVSTYAAWLLIGEVGALALEAAIYYAFLPRLGWPRAMVASALANLASYVLGVALLPLS